MLSEPGDLEVKRDSETALLEEIPVIIDQGELNLQKAIIATSSGFLSNEFAQAQAMLYGLDKPYSIPISVARAMLSQDEQGRDIKQNNQGRSLVVKIGDVYFKRNPSYPLVEQAVYQASLLLGGGIITPTRLLFIKVPEGVFPIQASLAVNGISFDKLLRIPGGICGLKSILGEAVLLQDLKVLISEAYCSQWLAKEGYTSEMPWEKQCDKLLDALFKLPRDQAPLEFQEAYDKYGFPLTEDHCIKFAKNIREGSAFIGRPLLPLLALLERYPKLGATDYLSNLIFLVEVFQSLKIMFPNFAKIPPEQLLQNAEQILQKLDRKSISRHLLLALLTEPEDHKGDNFIGIIEHTDEGELKPIQIIGIDNDSAMEGHIQAFNQEQHVARTKSIFYTLRELLQEPIHEEVQKEVASINPELALLQWLTQLECYYQRYLMLLTNASALATEVHLEEQLPKAFLPNFIRRIAAFQNCLRLIPVMTLEALFFKVEPILARYYQAFGQYDPQAFLVLLYDRRQPQYFESVLSDFLTEMLPSGSSIGASLQAIQKEGRVYE